MKQKTERKEEKSKQNTGKEGEKKPLHRNRAAMAKHEIEMKNDGRARQRNIHSVFGTKEIREREIAERESVKRDGFSLVWGIRELVNRDYIS